MRNLKESISDFIGHCQFEKNLNQKTIKAYSIDLDQFDAFVAKNVSFSSVQNIDKSILRAYVQSISAFKPKTIKRKLACTKTFFNFLEFEDKIHTNPFRKLKVQIREPHILPNVMNIVEVEKIIRLTYNVKHKAIAKDKYKYAEAIRDIAVLELLFATGARVSEISWLKDDCIDLFTGQVKLLGKGSKERIIQVCNQESIKALQEYHQLFKMKIEKCEGYFFINRFNNRLSEQSIRLLVKRCANDASIGRRITPHVFRHSFATLLLEKDVDIKYIQHLLGHSSIMTTQIYTHVNGEKQKRILSQSHPRENFKVI